MSGFTDLCSGVRAFHGDDVMKDPEDYIACYFVMVDYFPVYTCIMAWAIFLVTGSPFFYFLGNGMTIDKLINIALRFVFRQEGYDGTYQMPAQSSQFSMYSLSMILFFVLIYRINASTYRVFLATLFLTSVVYARVYLHINTPLQIFAGAFFGLLDASVQSVLFYFLIYKNKWWFLDTKFAQFVGLTSVFMVDESNLEPSVDEEFIFGDDDKDLDIITIPESKTMSPEEIRQYIHDRRLENM